MFYNAMRSQIKHLAQGTVLGEGRLGFSDLPTLAVQSLDNICGVNNLADLWRIVKDGAQDFLVFRLSFYAGRILPMRFLSKQAQIVLRLLQRYRRIYLLQAGGKLLDTLIADVLGGAVDGLYDL